jgi:geranylgeranyl pyrophosphate synthase
MFEPDQLERLAPRTRGEVRLCELKEHGIRELDPIAGTEAIAYDFLTRGGKHLRPFVTLAVFDALRGGLATGEDGAQVIQAWPDSVKRAAMSIETFHKASLVHDDIEDEDQFRYGSPALHRTYGVPTAINVGDYLIGLGYRLVSREGPSLGGDCVAEILNVLADSHQRLSEGQGAELLWRDAKDKRISPVDALRIYALKTAPAFEAAFLTGVRLAGPLDGFVEPVKKFARDLGIAFQILNDLADWQGDDHNKLSRAQDLIGGRPTVLWALALQDLSEAGRQELERLVNDASLAEAFRVQRAAQLYAEARVCDKAHRLIDKYEQRAKETTAQIQLEPLRDVLMYLVDLVLARHDDVQPTIQFIEPSTLAQAFPVTSP